MKISLPILRLSLSLLTVIGSSSGCRTIGRFGESRQSIAARSLARQGRKAMDTGDWNQAEQLFDDALAISVVDDRAHWGLAESLWQRGDHEGAIQHMEQAVHLSAGDPVLRCRLGRMYLDVERLGDATTESLLALQTDRQSDEIWTLRGDCLASDDRLDEALAAYHRALAIYSDNSRAQLQAAEIYYRQNRFDRLLASLDRLHNNPNVLETSGRVHLLRGVAMRNMGRADEAKRCLIAAIEQLPEDPSVHLQMASLASEMGDYSAANSAFQTAQRLDPGLSNTIKHDPGLVNDETIRQLSGQRFALNPLSDNPIEKR